MDGAEFHFSPRPNRAHEIKWRPWTQAAFDEAKLLDKPILLSISAVWCHWCHVMDETTYSNDRVIDLVNSEYLPIRVDNDVRPDINQRYNMGGWPTTAFLTSSGDILTGATYLPPDQMVGALDRVASYYRTHRPEIATKALEGRKRAGATAARSAGELDNGLVDTVLDAVKNAYDPAYGGFGNAPKFPQTDALLLLLEQAQIRSDPELRRMAVHTLEQMAGGGTYDHVEGGGSPPPAQDGALFDPWGHQYGIIMDTNGDNRIDLQGVYSDFSGADPTSGLAPRQTAWAFSMGKDE